MTDTKPSVLVVDDKPNMLRLMTKVLGGIAQVHTAGNGKDAVAILDSEVVDVVVCDLRMPDLTGLEVLALCKARQPRARFILMTAYATVETAITALKDGAYDYLMKPFEPDEVKTTVLRALHSLAPRPLVAEDDELLPGVHARSSVMRELAAVVQQIAATSISILVGGESGAGKGQLARAIHRLSAFREHPLYSLDCRTLPAGGVQEALTRVGPVGGGRSYRRHPGAARSSSTKSTFWDTLSKQRWRMGSRGSAGRRHRRTQAFGWSRRRSATWTRWSLTARFVASCSSRFVSPLSRSRR